MTEQELVTQISLALARDGVAHRIIGPKSVTKLAVMQHRAELGRDYINPTSQVAVIGVDTLLRRATDVRSWAASVRLVVMDEAHHVLRANKWGQALDLFPAAKVLGVVVAVGAQFVQAREDLALHPEALVFGKVPVHHVEFHRSHADVIFKPLDGMGGSGIFRCKADDGNLASILE